MKVSRTYHVRHRRQHIINDLLKKALCVAEYAVKNKKNKTLRTSKYVKEYGLPSAISNQILRKYGKGTIRKVSNINLIVPNQHVSRKLKDGTIRVHDSILYDQNKGTVYMKCLKMTFRWNPGKIFKRINQVEISENKFMISITIEDDPERGHPRRALGIDLNCGRGRSIANCANLRNGEIINLGKNGPGMRNAYYKKIKNQNIKGDRLHRRMKDLDHKISRQIVDYAYKHKLKIVVEDLTGIRDKVRKGNGLKHLNRLVNSWSFYRLQTFIEYKAKERGIPYRKINPQYTSQECSYCSIIGYRKGDTFKCKNRHCEVYNKKRHSDVNAAFNIGKRSYQPHW